MTLQDNIKYDDIVFGDKCGCYSCRKIFSPDQIEVTTYEETLDSEIAVCPFCDEATVVGDLNHDLDNKSLDDLSKSELGSSYYRSIN
jgi:hypothetical protein